jgi:hypothetical protein
MGLRIGVGAASVYPPMGDSAPTKVDPGCDLGRLSLARVRA